MKTTFTLEATRLYDAERELGGKEKWDGSAFSGHPQIERDALDIVWRGGGFPNNAASGESGEYFAFDFDGTKTLGQNINNILSTDSDLEMPDKDAWWPMIVKSDGTGALQDYYLINPSNPPLEKREGYGDYRFPVLRYRTKGAYGVSKDSWYLTTIGATEDGRLGEYGQTQQKCKIYFKKKAPVSHWKQQLELYQIFTGRPWYNGGKRPEPELTAYGKKILAHMDTRNLPDREVTTEGLSEAERKILEGLGGSLVSRRTFDTLVEFASRQCIGTIRVIDPDTVASFQQDFSYSGSGGSAYFSKLYVWHLGQMKQESYQWRDAYNPSNDKPWLCIRDINPLRSKIEANNITLCLESREGSRSVSLVFDQPQWTSSKEELANEVFASNAFLVLSSPGLFLKFLKRLFHKWLPPREVDID
jgi:hypothetical protein